MRLTGKREDHPLLSAVMVSNFGKKIIIHVDMDAFYPSVEVLDNPDLSGKAVVVGGSRERGVVSSASYEARKFGIHSAQPMARAMRLCPHAVFLRGRMSRYREISGRVFEIFQRFTPLLEKLSIDEAFLDVSGCGRLFGSPEEMARKIKDAILREIGLTASAGVAPSKFVAKIASDLEKPDGLTVVPEEKVREFLGPLPVSKMWGVGKVTREALGKLNIRTFRDLSRMPVGVLERRFGKYGTRMHELSTGIDERDVVPDHDPKSIGHEETFSEDIIDRDYIARELLFLAGKVARRMRKDSLQGKTVTLKVKYGDFTSITRSETLPAPTDDAGEIYRAVLTLLNKTEVGRRPVRLLGVSLSQLLDGRMERQLSLFTEEEDFTNRKKNLNAALDSISEKFGDQIIGPGMLLNK